MARRIPVPIHIDIPYGQDGQITFYINDVLYENVTDYVIKKYLNSIYTVTGTLYGADKTDTDVATGNTIKIFAGASLLMVGILDKPTWKSYDEVTINGICRVSSKLKDARVGNNIENESYFDNKTSTYITNRLCSIGNDGSAPWIVTPNNIDSFTKLFVRGDNDNKMSIIMNMAKDINYNWYPSYGTTPYNDTTLNIEDHKGSQSPVMTLTAGGSSQNVELSSREENRDELWNDVLVCGYGDGINQIKSRCLSSSVNKTALTSDITATATTATVDDGTKLAASGTVVIGCEKIVYTRSSNTLTLTRSTATFLTGTNVTETYAHNAGIVVYDYNAPTSPEANSSMDTYGHKASPPQTDRSIMDQNTLDRTAQIILDEHDEELVRIEVIAMDMFDILDDVVIGDYVTVTETEVGNDGDYRVVGMEISEYELKVVCSNTPRIISETIASIEEQEKNLNYYAQGATNIYAINEAENCDSSNYLDMRFYIPPEAIGINNILLSFKLKDFRSYSATTGTGSAHNHPVTMTNAGGHNHTVTDPQHSHSISAATSGSFLNPSTIGGHSAIVVGTGTSTKAVWMPVQDLSVGSFYYGNAVLSVYLTNSSSQNFNLEFYRNVSWNTIYSSWTGTKDEDADYTMYDNDCTTRFHTPWTSTDIRGETVLVHLIPLSSVTQYFAIFSPNVYASHTHSINATTAINSATGVTVSSTDGTHNHQATTATSNESAHTHGVTGAITTTALTSPSIDLYTGEDGGAMTQKGTYTNTTNEVDITTEIRAIGSSKWIDVQFRANKLMRIEATLYIQTFIRSD